MTGGDWVTDTAGTLLTASWLTAQAKGAEQLARDVVKDHPDVIFVGHSLGGRLAQIGRLITGNEAVIFNSAPVGISEATKVISAVINNPQGGLTGFRGPQDPLGVIDPASGYRDVVVENIFRAEGLPLKGALSEAYVRIEQRKFFHGAGVLARAMQDVRMARDEGWIAAYQNSKTN